MARKARPKPKAAPAESPGGKGGGTGPNLDPASQTSDTRLLERAIRERWDVPEHIRRDGPAEIAKVITSKGSSQRNKIAAFRALVAADAQNVAAEKGAEPPGVNVNVNVSSTYNVDLSKATPDDLRQLRDLQRRLAGVPR